MKSTILLVEDNKELLNVLAEELNENYEILKAMNGQQALNALSNEAIELVVSDVMMPVIDGFELCKIIKSNFEYNHLPVILLTAKNTLQAKIQGLGLGADAYIEKPFDVEHLQAQIESLLANRRKIREHFAALPTLPLKSGGETGSNKSFLDRLSEVIHANLDDHDLDINKLTGLMNLGRTSLFRKIKSVTDLTPNELINIIRLKKAAQLLSDEDFRIYQVSEMVGFSSQTNFGRKFFQQFGVTPKEYQKNKREGK